MNRNIEILVEQLNCLMKYLKPFLPLANAHMVDYFLTNIYENLIPYKIREDIQKVGYKEVINCILSDDLEQLPNLNFYKKKSNEFTLKNLKTCLKPEEFHEKLVSLGCSNPLRLKLNVFMTSKKSHEVDVLSYMAAALNSISKTTHLIDIGDGKGYLSSMLALHHNIPVLGIDASQVNTRGAITRVNKLSKAWNKGILFKNNDKEFTENEECTGQEKELKQVKHKDDLRELKKRASVDLYKQVTKYVDTNIDMVGLVDSIFLQKPGGLGLVGLHTCGDLSSTSIKIFTMNPDIKTICNVGCCYHLLTECFENSSDNTNFKDNQGYGFPMSRHVKEEKFTIGRAGRMIAAQSIERVLATKKLPNETIFYRALFELILNKEIEGLPFDRKQVGKIGKKCDNFVDYSRKAFKKLNLNSSITDGELENLFLQYKDREYELYVFYLIRNMLSPLIESLILMDRLLYVYESGIKNAYLVQLFDPVVSPRCYGLVAMK